MLAQLGCHGQMGQCYTSSRLPCCRIRLAITVSHNTHVPPDRMPVPDHARCYPIAVEPFRRAQDRRSRPLMLRSDLSAHMEEGLLYLPNPYT